jgi:hypothetical protein
MELLVDCYYIVSVTFQLLGRILLSSAFRQSGGLFCYHVVGYTRCMALHLHSYVL